MDDLVAFLYARLEDDLQSCEGANEYRDCDEFSERRRLDVEAKRRIIDEHRPVRASWPISGSPEFGCETCHHDREEGVGPFGYCDTLRLLALPYVDHPDHVMAWRL
ncbi:DUF6221 family protein [Actinomadura sp. SCN-SB]|uniref:DUF6221 family protein n=1 Tax=Actinomadura sp. SCN-SB TaxID=3373092 RepID=UPI003750AE04